MADNTKSKNGFWIILIGICVLALVAIGLGTDTFKKSSDTNATPAIENTAANDMAGDMAAADANPNAAKTVAIVNGQVITQADMDDFLAMLPPQMKSAPLTEIYPMVQEQLVANSILLQKAEATIDTTNAEVTKRMEEARKQIIRGLYLEQEVEKHINQADLQKAYDDFKAKQETPEEVSARHILVPTEAEATDLIAKLQAGEDFKKLSAAHSQDPGTKATGELGYFTRDMMVKEFADAAFSMNKGEISKAPVKTQFGYHVIQIMDKRTRPIPTLEQMKPTLEAEMRRNAFTTVLGDLRNGAKVELYDLNGVKTDAVKADAAPVEAAPSPQE